jgi:hypothetical protein
LCDNLFIDVILAQAMAQVNIDMNSFVSAQVFAQMSEEDKQKLFTEAIEKILDGESLKRIAKEEALRIAREEVQSILGENTETRQRIVGLVNDAFAEIIKGDDAEIKARLVEGILKTLTGSRY